MFVFLVDHGLGLSVMSEMTKGLRTFVSDVAFAQHNVRG